jgi:hypothetical protein
LNAGQITAITGSYEALRKGKKNERGREECGVGGSREGGRGREGGREREKLPNLSKKT